LDSEALSSALLNTLRKIVKTWLAVQYDGMIGPVSWLPSSGRVSGSASLLAIRSDVRASSKHSSR